MGIIDLYYELGKKWLKVLILGGSVGPHDLKYGLFHKMEGLRILLNRDMKITINHICLIKSVLVTL